MLKLRWYQEETITEVERQWDNDGSPTLAIAATGSGKTAAFLALLDKMIRLHPAARAIVVAHTEELIFQPCEKAEEYGLDISKCMGIVMAGRSDDDAQVVVATIQTLTSNGRLDKILAHGLPQYVVIDEAHHAPAGTYKKLLQRLADAGCTDLKVLGVTATPVRTDKDGLRGVFKTVAYKFTIDKAVEAGVLVPFQALGFELPITLEGVRETGEDWAAEPMGDLLKAENILQIVTEKWREHASDRQTVIFTASVAQAVAQAAHMREHGIAAESVSGVTAKDERARLLREYKAGRIQVLVNCMVLTEGWDAPETSCICMVCPTKSDLRYVQRLGRGLRPAKGKNNCIAEGQRVLTDHGLVPIERITRKMKVWDGSLFVSHDGVIFRGEQEVVTYAGLTATPDHRAWTRKGWRTFGECAARKIPIVVTGAGRRPIREIRGYLRGATKKEEEQVLPGALHDLWRSRVARTEQPFEGNGWMPPMWASKAGPQVALSAHSGSTGEMPKSEGSPLQGLWGPGDRIPILQSVRNGAMDHEESGISSRDDARQDRQRWPLRAGESAMGDPAEEYGEPTQKPCGSFSCFSAKVPGSSLCGCNLAAPLGTRANLYPDQGTILSPVEQTKRRVWDILNAGPRHRFTVEGLLVSNCLVLDFAPKDEREMVFAGDVLGVPRKVAVAKERAESAGVMISALSMDMFGHAAAVDPSDLTVRVLNYMTKKSTLAWTYEGSLAVAGLNTTTTLALVLPDSERLAQGEAKRREGNHWGPRSERWYQWLQRVHVLVIRKDPVTRRTEAGLAGSFVELADAQEKASEIAKDEAEDILANRKKGWRDAVPSPKQCEWLTRLGIAIPETKGQAAQLLTVATAKQAVARWAERERRAYWGDTKGAGK